MQDFARRALVAGAVVIALVAVALIVWFTADVLLLVFAAALVALLLRTAAGWLAAKLGIGSGWGLVVCLCGTALAIASAIWFLLPRLSDQFEALSAQLPQVINEVRKRTARYPGLAAHLENVAKSPAISRVFSTTLGAAGNIVVVLFAGLYFAVAPRTYTGGFARLFPPHLRPKVGEWMRTVAATLRWWMLGKMAGMLFIAVGSIAGLLLLGVPLAVPLGILAGLLDFIPNIGPLIALIPAALMALLHSPMSVVYVVVLYFGLQIAESYILVPHIQQKTISLPPAVTITGQVFFGLLLGGLGLLLATPMTAAILVSVKLLYVRDTLGEHVHLPK